MHWKKKNISSRINKKIKKQLVASLFFLCLCSYSYAHNLFFDKPDVLTDYPRIVLSSIDTVCNQENSAYVVIFNIEQGDINSYAVDGTGTLVGDQFISDFIPSGDPFIFIVTDANQCGADTIVGEYACRCQSSIGELRPAELYPCSQDTLRATDYYDPVGQVILGNDARSYLLSSSELNPIAALISASSDGLFWFDETIMNYGQPYFVVAVIGRRVGADAVDLADRCLQISQPLSITWYDEIDSFSIISSGLEITCDQPTIELLISTLQDTAGYEIIWDGENGGVIAPADSFNHSLTVAVAGRYVASFRHPIADCETSMFVDIVLSSELPTAFIEDPQFITCAQEQVILSGRGSTMNQNIIYNWSGPGLISGADSIVVLVNEPGVYFLTVNDTLADCQVTTSKTVMDDITPPAVIALANEKIDCDSEQVNVSGLGSSVGFNFTYEWRVLIDSGNIISSISQRDIVVDQPGHYELMVINTTNGCVAMDSVWVEYDENYIRGAQINLIQPACSGASDGVIEIASIDGGTPPLNYSFDGGLTSISNTIFDNLAPGIYPILIEDAQACIYRDTVVLTAPYDFEVDLGMDQILGQGDEVVIVAQTDLPDSLIKSITWIPTFDSLNRNNLIQEFSPPLGFYPTTIFIENNNGCVETDQINIILKFEKRFFIPNSLNPSSNNENNKYINIYSDPESVASISNFNIYDRWGNRVFQRTNIPVDLNLNAEYAWDGTKNGKPLNPGVYVYRVVINFIDGQREVEINEITLVR